MTTITLKKESQIAHLTITSPPANALSSTIMEDIHRQLDEIEKDSTIKAVLLKGEGKFFSAGADIKEFTSLEDPSQFQSLSAKGQKVFSRIEQFEIPFVAAIHGAALGGGLELAMACHIRVVSETAKLGLPELTLGLVPGFAGTQRLPQLIGPAKAYELMLTGDPVDGVQAESLGLANVAVSEENVESEALRLAESIVAKSKPTITKVLELVSYARAGDYEKGAALESEAFGKIFDTKDAEEGIQAFMEKREPNFRDQ